MVVNLNLRRKYGIFSKASLHYTSYVLLIVYPSQKKRETKAVKIDILGL